MKLTASGLMIPGRMNEEPKHKCNFPGCDWLGYTQQEQVAHVKEHVREDEAEIVEFVKAPSEDIFGEGDPEYRKYLSDRRRSLLGQVPDPDDPRHY